MYHYRITFGSSDIATPQNNLCHIIILLAAIGLCVVTTESWATYRISDELSNESANHGFCYESPNQRTTLRTTNHIRYGRVNQIITESSHNHQTTSDTEPLLGFVFALIRLWCYINESPRITAILTNHHDIVTTSEILSVPYRIQTNQSRYKTTICFILANHMMSYIQSWIN